MHARDRRYVGFYRRGLFAGLYTILDKRADGLWVRRQIRLAEGFAKRLENRAVALLRAQRIGRASALGECLPFEQGRQRALKDRSRRDRQWIEFRGPLDHFHPILMIRKKFHRR